MRNKSLNLDYYYNINCLSYIIVIYNLNNILALIIIKILIIKVYNTKRDKKSNKNKS
jgi:hypothetical protein